jgi:hypothetical protein
MATDKSETSDRVRHSSSLDTYAIITALLLSEVCVGFCQAANIHRARAQSPWIPSAAAAQRRKAATARLYARRKEARNVAIGYKLLKNASTVSKSPSWKSIKVTSLNSMFYGCSVFNQNLAVGACTCDNTKILDTCSILVKTRNIADVLAAHKCDHNKILRLRAAGLRRFTAWKNRILVSACPSPAHTKSVGSGPPSPAHTQSVASGPFYESFQILVQLSPGRSIFVDVEPSDRIQDIKVKIQEKSGLMILPGQNLQTFAGFVLQSN